VTRPSKGVVSVRKKLKEWNNSPSKKGHGDAGGGGSRESEVTPRGVRKDALLNCRVGGGQKSTKHAKRGKKGKKKRDGGEKKGGNSALLKILNQT